ncbi:hypothetical protein M5689_024944 [Euphorbia peplus]|nr:hypothetical protein M5689_024944 [Euphorbia peplus]
MPRSNRTGKFQFDPEIEKTACRLRKQTREQKESKLPGLGVAIEFSESSLSASDSSSEFEEEVEMEEQTLRNMDNQDPVQQPLCIEYLELEVNSELKSGLIHLLPTFRGLSGEDPHKHLKELHVVSSSMKPRDVTVEQIKMRAFPFSLTDKAKDWLYYLPPRSITTWSEMQKQFLEKFFPASRVTSIRKDISRSRQLQGENLHECWERFNQLCTSCPNHQISDQLLIRYFYEGLILSDRNLIDATSGGALVDKTVTEVRNLISRVAANAQQFGSRQGGSEKKVNEVSSSSVEKRLDALTSLVQKALLGNTQQVKTCGICSSLDHPADACHTLQEEE